jgi:hypothetical protein
LRPKLAAMMVLLSWLVIAVACNSSATGTGSSTSREPYSDTPEGKPPNLGAPVPNPKEVLETKPAGQLPDFLSKLEGKARERTTALYKAAADHYDEFGHIPCYCGCALYATPHKSLTACFIKEEKAGGELVFTDHSLTCDLCQQAAQMAVEGLEKGTPQKEVRANIFDKLKYTGIWTDTPPAP